MSRPTFSPAPTGQEVFGKEDGCAVAVVVRVLGDIDVAEETVRDAFPAAVQRWPATGLRRSNYTGVIRACRAGTLNRRPSPPCPRGWCVVSGPQVLAVARTREDVEDCATLQPIRCKEDRCRQRRHTLRRWTIVLNGLAAHAASRSCRWTAAA